MSRFITTLLIATQILCMYGQGQVKESSNGMACSSCRLIAEAVEELWSKNETEKYIGRLVTYFCTKLHIEDGYICQAIVSQFREEFLYVLGRLVLSPRQLCGLLLPHCGHPLNPFLSNWTLSLPRPVPPRPRPVPIPPITGPRLRILQLSDFHFDSHYSPRTEADCSQPVCCHRNSYNRHTSSNISIAAGYWGTTTACDLPYWTVEQMIRHISATENIDYILIAGDLMSHSDWTYTKDGHVEIIQNVTRLMNKYFPLTPLFWTVGNHEGVPVNSFAPHTVPRKYWPTWLYTALNRSWKRWLPAKTTNSILYRASYSVLITDRLRLISVNTGYCDRTNFWLYINQTDPDGTLEWLCNELYSAEKLGQKVQILGHIPPGSGECLQQWAKNYYRIINRFESTIVGQFFGHIHTDYFSVFYENMNDYKSRPTNVMYIAPSVTTFKQLNPAYRIYTIDGNYPNSTYQVLNHETWYLNLSEANAQSGMPQWKLLYRAIDEYGLESLQPSEWNRLIGKLKTNASFFKTFLRNYSRRDRFKCDKKCHYDILCSLRSGMRNDKHLCPDIERPRQKDLPNQTKAFTVDWDELINLKREN